MAIVVLTLRCRFSEQLQALLQDLQNLDPSTVVCTQETKKMSKKLRNVLLSLCLYLPPAVYP